MRLSGFVKGILLIVVLFAVFANIPNAIPERWRDNIPIIKDLNPVTLGLDLRGGAYLLLEINEKELRQSRLELYANDIRRNLNQEKIVTESFKISNDTINIVLVDVGDLDSTNKILNSVVPGSSIKVDGNRIKTSLTDSQLRDEYSRAIEQSIEVIRRRIDESGTKEAQIRRQGSNRIVVELAGDQNPDRIKALLGKTAKLTFQLISISGQDALARNLALPAGSLRVDSYYKSSDGNPLYQNAVERRIYLTGEHLIDARPSIDNQGSPIVQFRLDSGGSRRFENLTRKNVGRRLAVLLDNQIISSPNIREPIGGGTVIIEGGSMTIDEAQDLALLMRSGALPVSLTVLEERTVGPGLGSDSINSGLRAIWIGIFFVFAYILLIYRRFGFFACQVLTLNMVLLLGVITFIGGTLTLPGMAGLVLTVGMMVDSNVLIYERIRDEYYHEHGYNVQLSVDRGYKSAVSSILDSNLTTLLAAVILVSLSSGSVRGFALTLSVGILTSLFTSLVLTRWLVSRWLNKIKNKQVVLPF